MTGDCGASCLHDTHPEDRPVFVKFLKSPHHEGKDWEGRDWIDGIWIEDPRPEVKREERHTEMVWKPAGKRKSNVWGRIALKGGRLMKRNAHNHDSHAVENPLQKRDDNIWSRIQKKDDNIWARIQKKGDDNIWARIQKKDDQWGRISRKRSMSSDENTWARILKRKAGASVQDWGRPTHKARDRNYWCEEVTCVKLENSL